MKTLRLSLVSLVTILSASATFAGPGPQYWAAQRVARISTAPAVTAVVAAQCESMIVKQGKRTSTVKCDASTAETSKCKAACAS